MILTVDTETTGLDFWHGCRAFMLTACDGTHSWVWSGAVNPFDRSEVTWDQNDLDEIQRLLDSSSEIVIHNAKFDMRAMYHMGLNIDGWWHKVQDTVIAHHCLNSADSHALKDLAIKYLDWHNTDEKKLARIIQQKRLEHKDYDLAVVGHKCFPGVNRTKNLFKQDYWLDIEACAKYGISDVEMTWLLWDVFKSALKEECLWNIYQTRRELLYITYCIEDCGLDLVPDKVRSEIPKLQLKAENLRLKIQELCEYKFHWDPSDRELLHHFFFNTLDIEPRYFTKTGEPSLNKEAINGYIEDNPDKKALLYYSTYAKTLTQISDLKSYLRWVTPDNKIHSSLWITGTRETRQSSSDPNLQNIPRKLREVFEPEPGYTWIDFDYSNIEMRIWAYLVNSKRLIEVFETTGSIHLLFGEILYPTLFKELGAKRFSETDEYKYVKNGNFCIIYGGGQRKADLNYRVAGAYQTISTKLPEVPMFSRRCVEEVHKNQLLFGRPQIEALGGYMLDVPLDKIYKAANYKVQGTAGWIMTEAMINVNNNQLYLDTGCQINQQVHDSLQIKVKTKYVTDDLIESIKTSMIEPALKYIPTCGVDHKIRVGKDVNI